MICPNAEKQGDWRTEEPNIRWNPAKSALKDWLNSYEENDLITIIPFNDDVIDALSFKKKDFDWNNIESILDNAVKSHHGKTSICNAWKKAEKFFDSSKYNFFYIITDGMDDHNGPCTLVEQINSFCSKIPEGSHGYFLNLAQAAFPKEVMDALSASDCISIAPPISTPFGRFLTDSISVATNNMKSGGKDEVALEFDRKQEYPMDIDSDDPYFTADLTNGIVEKGVLRLKIGLRNGVDLAELKKELNSDTYSFAVHLSSSSIKIIDNEDVDIKVILKPITELALLTNETQIELGKAKWFDKFIIPMKLPDTLSYVFRPVFNDEALLQNASATLKAINLPPKTKLLINGTDFTNKSFTISSNDSIVLQFVSEVPCDNHDIEANIVIEDVKNIERLISSRIYDNPKEFSVGVFGEVRESMNPLKLCLIIVCIILLILFVMRSLFNLAIRPTMIGRINKVDNNGNTIEGLGDITGFHEVYLTPDKSRSYTGILNSLLIGKRLYIHISGLPSPIKITGKSDKTIFFHPNKKIKINGVVPLYKIKYKGRTIVNISREDDTDIVRIKYF